MPLLKSSVAAQEPVSERFDGIKINIKRKLSNLPTDEWWIPYLKKGSQLKGNEAVSKTECKNVVQRKSISDATRKLRNPLPGQRAHKF